MRVEAKTLRWPHLSQIYAMPLLTNPTYNCVRELMLSHTCWLVPCQLVPASILGFLTTVIPLGWPSGPIKRPSCRSCSGTWAIRSGVNITAGITTKEQLKEDGVPGVFILPCNVYWGTVGLRGSGAGQCLFVVHECFVVNSWMSALRICA